MRMPITAEGLAPTSVVGPLLELLISGVPILLGALKWVRPRFLVSRDDAAYKVLDCRVRLTLEDPRGTSATYVKTERVRMLRPNLAYLSEFAWGDGDQFARHRAGHGRIIERQPEGSRYRSIVQLARRSRRGDVVQLTSRRSIRNGFRSDREWLEFDVMHRTQRLVLLVTFPPSRPPQRATVSYGSQEAEALRVRRSGNQPSIVRYSLREPRIGRYIIQWTW